MENYSRWNILNAESKDVRRMKNPTQLGIAFGHVFVSDEELIGRCKSGFIKKESFILESIRRFPLLLKYN